MERLLIAKGRGIATNVPENELIKQVRRRPLLYDKNASEYRKPCVSDAAWSEVAEALNTTVVNVKKRWKSLRDTFIKYYRIEQQQANSKNGHKDMKKRRWHFYNDLKFLQAHVELFRLDENSRVNDETSKDEALPIYLKDDDFFFESESPEGIRYQIKINDEQELYEVATENSVEDHLIEGFSEGCNEDSRIELETDGLISNDNDQQPSKYVLLDEPNEEGVVDEEVESTLNIQKIDPEPASPTTSISEPTQVTIIDQDERYLLSCLPAFKRFSPQQKALVRMGIERLFYEVEFEPANKKLKA